MLMALRTTFIATIGQMPRTALKTIRIRHATRLSARKRSTRACMREKTRSALPPQPSTSSQFTRGDYRHACRNNSSAAAHAARRHLARPVGHAGPPLSAKSHNEPHRGTRLGEQMSWSRVEVDVARLNACPSLLVVPSSGSGASSA